MALSDLEAALTSLDTQIAAITADLAKMANGTVSADGMSVTHRTLDELIGAREKLRMLIAQDGGNAFEVHSRWVP